MKIYNAKIELRESELKELIAEAFGVKPMDISFNVVAMQRDHNTICTTITKAVTVNRVFGKEEDPDPDERSIDYEIVLDPEMLRKGPCADD